MTSTPESPAILSIPDLRAELSGEVIAPEDPGYDEARLVFVRGIDRRPAVIARPADADDVARVVSLSRDTGLELAVRSGGHSAAGFGTSEGGILLDLSSMSAVEVDVDAREAWTETGSTTGAYTVATSEHGLVTGFGDSGSVGISGITLSGGIGYLVRRNGLTIDDMLGAEVVTADGQLHHVDADNEPDLFWALRGGGGNFGVVTRLRLRLHEIDEIVGGMLMLPATPEVITGFIAGAEQAPEELSTIANVMLAPPMPFIPAEHHGKPVIMALMAYSGEVEDGEPAFAPFRSLATPLADMVRPLRYPELFEGPEGPNPVAATIQTMFLDGVDGDASEAMLTQIEASTAERAIVQLRVLGGAMARVPADATAFAHRDRRIMANVVATYADPAEAPEQGTWVAGLAEALRDGGPGAYAGFLGDDGEAAVRDAYPGRTWDRLAAIKQRYDPTNLFRVNQNIPPSEDASNES